MKASILTLLLWLLVLDALGAVRSRRHHEIPIRSSRSLRTQVDSYAELLQKEVIKAKNPRDKFRAVNRVLGQIQALRDNGAPQGALDEAHMDLLVSVLESLPRESQFRKRDCSKYENDLLTQYEPMADESPSEPAVTPGWNVLQSLCR